MCSNNGNEKITGGNLAEKKKIMIDGEFFQRMRAQQIADRMDQSDRRVDPSIPIPGVNMPDFSSGEEAIAEYCSKQGITREQFDQIPAYKRRKQK